MSTEQLQLLQRAVRGAAEVTRNSYAVQPRRLPGWTHDRAASAHLAWTADRTAGVRLDLQTDASRLSLTVTCTLTLDHTADPAAHPAVFVATIPGETADADVVDEVTAVSAGLRRVGPGTEVREDDGATETLEFDLGPAAHNRDVTVWLPQRAEVLLHGIDGDRPIRAAAPDERLTWVHYGGATGSVAPGAGPLDSWTVQVARGADVDLIDLGLSGEAHLDPSIGGVVLHTEPDLVSIAVGADIVRAGSFALRTVVPALHALLDTLREARPALPILLITPFHRPDLEHHDDSSGTAAAPFGVLRATDADRLTVATLRRVLPELVALRDDENLFLLDGRDILGPGEEMMLDADGDPTPDGAREIAARFRHLEPVQRWATPPAPVLPDNASGSPFSPVSPGSPAPRED